MKQQQQSDRLQHWVQTMPCWRTLPSNPALPDWQQQFQSWNKSYWDVWGLFAEWNGELDENTRITAGGRFNFITKKDVVMDGLADISGTLAGYNGTAALQVEHQMVSQFFQNMKRTSMNSQVES